MNLLSGTSLVLSLSLLFASPTLVRYIKHGSFLIDLHDMASPSLQQHVFQPMTDQNSIFLGSQVILYFVSSGLVYISESIHTNVGNWLLTDNTLVVAGTCPFVGYMTDLLGMCLGGSPYNIAAMADNSLPRSKMAHHCRSRAPESLQRGDGNFAFFRVSHHVHGSWWCWSGNLRAYCNRWVRNPIISTLGHEPLLKYRGQCC